MPKFKNAAGHEIETSNQVEIVRLRASGYGPVDKKQTEQTEQTEQGQTGAAGGSSDDSGDKPKGSGRGSRS